MTESDARLQALEARLEAVEAQLEIRDVFARYGFAVDSGDADAAAALFSPDSVTTVDEGRLVLHGQEGIREMVLGSEHQSILPGSSHTIGPVLVEVDGDEAFVIGYSRVDYSEDHRISPIRSAANLWRLARTDGAWMIVERQTQFLGTSVGQGLLHRGLTPS
ncbi:MAG TPA: nuclear transport factor 2 family protein [Solirubrobacteraceae bacterium]|jgi:uncharacterized protein (TIGR02246 family)|nr:nuclear transport factor 2 family protein [Solirubrobacteraceae bacterium]